MRLRTLAGTLALAALAACDHTPVSTDAAALVALWGSGVVHVTATTPDGQRDLERTEQWRFLANGLYQREAVLFDRAAGRSYYEFVDQGSWAVDRPGIVKLVAEQEFYASPFQPAAQPVLHPGSGFVQRYAFTIRGDVLEVRFICPPDADCLPVVPLPLQRMPELFVTRLAAP